MFIVVEQVIRGNKREVPGDIPPLLWWEKIAEFQAHPDIDLVSFGDELREYLPESEIEKLRRVKAKAVIWRDILGVWPDDISVWWELRQWRKAGILPWPEEAFEAVIDDEDTLHCGKCGARWSAARPNPFWCKLCGSPVKEDIWVSS